MSSNYKNKAVVFIIIFLEILSSMNLFSQAHKIYNDSIQKHYNFIMAASSGDIDEINTAIKKGVNVNHRDADGGTALFYAVSDEHTEVVKILLYYDADPNLGLYNGYTPLMNAASFSFEMSELLLLKPQTEVDRIDENRSAAIHYAAYYGQYSIVDMLLFYDANTNLKTKDNSSVFLLSVYSADTSLMSLLVDKDNNPIDKNDDNISPYSVAIQYNDSIVFDYLVDNDLSLTFITNNANILIEEAIKHKNTYALNRILNLSNTDKSEEKTTELLYAAYLYNNKEAITVLEKRDFSKPLLPIPSSATASFAHSFNFNDYVSYFGIGVKDARYNLSFDILYGTRFKPQAFLDEIEENTFYQHWERRNLLAFQLRKYFSIYENNSFTISPFISADVQWHWLRYNGRSKKINGIAYIVPEMGISIGSHFFDIDISYQYANYHIYDVSPHKFKIGIKGILPFYSKPHKYHPSWI